MKTVATIIMVMVASLTFAQTKVQGMEVVTDCKTLNIYVIYQGDIWIKHNETPLEYEWGWD